VGHRATHGSAEFLRIKVAETELSMSERRGDDDRDAGVVTQNCTALLEKRKKILQDRRRV